MATHEEVLGQLMKRPAVKREVARIERDEGERLDLLHGTRHEGGLAQAAVAKGVGTQPPASARLVSTRAPKQPKRRQR